MKYFIFLFFLNCGLLTAQVGIGTTSPEGALDISSTNQGVVVPRVTSIDDVTDGNGNPAVDGTIVYDTSQEKTCYRIAGNWLCLGIDSSGNGVISVDNGNFSQVSNYIKASNTNANDAFGWSISLSDDGSRLAVGAYRESSNATGINGDESNDTAFQSGAVYVFLRAGNMWTQEAYIKASNTNPTDRFGWEVSLNADGSRLAVGAYNEDSNAIGVNGDPTDNSATEAGAAYIFHRIGNTWTQEAYIKASNTNPGDLFGYSLGISGDGSRLVVGAYREDSGVPGINGNQLDNSVNDAGAAYVFLRTGTVWAQEAYIKSSNPDVNDYFSGHVDINYDGSRMLLNSAFEDSASNMINGNQTDNSAVDAGAAYVFSRTGSTWSQEAYLKADNAEADDRFGWNVRISGDGTTALIGAPLEDSNSSGINGDGTDNTAANSGAAYVFVRTGSTWSQQAYLKMNFPDINDQFGFAVSTSSNGSKIAVGAYRESGGSTGIGGIETSNAAPSSGGVFTFTRSGTLWAQTNYIKASNTETQDFFGIFLELSGNGNILAVGASFEDSNATGINGDQSNNSASSSGAVYIIE